MSQEDIVQINPKAQQLIKQKNFRQMVKNLKSNEIMDFVTRFPEFLRPNDEKKAKQSLRQIAICFSVGVGIGVAVNVKLKSIYPGFLAMNLPAKLICRTLVFITPVWIGYRMIAYPARKQLNAQLDQMHKNLIVLGDDGNLKKYFTQ